MHSCAQARAGSNYPFLTQKERDIETGLDYFLARYYSSTQGRFTSPDEFTGGPDELYNFTDQASENPTFYAELSNPQSLNKYQYTYNNPINLVDADGHCPVCPFDPQGPKRVVDGLLNVGGKGLDIVQTGLSVVGSIPAVGEGADLVNAAISSARGNYGEAELDLGGALGPVGSGVAVGNRVRKITGAADDAAQAIRNTDNAADAARAAPKAGSQGGPGAGKNFPKATKDAERTASNNSWRTNN